MSRLDGVVELLSTVKRLKEEGTEAVQVEPLLRYLEELVADLEMDSDRTHLLGQLELEAYKAREAAALAAQSLNHTSGLEMFKATIAAGANARKDSLWANGGAAVAILALAGHFVSSGNAVEVKSFIPAMQAFVAGVLAAVLTTGFTYLSQWGYQEDPPHWHHKIGVAAHVCALLCWICSCAAFVVGAMCAADAFKMAG